MAEYRIDCVNKPDRNSPHEAITHVGGPNPNGVGRWKEPVGTVVKLIESKTHSFFTRDTAGRTAWVGVNTSKSGNKFLQTYADGVWSNNLLAQPECA